MIMIEMHQRGILGKRSLRSLSFFFQFSTLNINIVIFIVIFFVIFFSITLDHI